MINYIICIYIIFVHNYIINDRFYYTLLNKLKELLVLLNTFVTIPHILYNCLCTPDALLDTMPPYLSRPVAGNMMH